MWVFRQVLYRFPKEQEMRIFDGCENGQKIVKNLFKIVHTFSVLRGIIINVKAPTLYSFCYTP